MNWVKHPKYNLEVSSTGLVKGATGTIRKPRKDRYGYLRLNISIGNYKTKTLLIHRLVVDCFNVRGVGKTVDHIDGNKENNNIENLQLVSAEENTALCFKRGHHSSCHAVLINDVLCYSKREAERIFNVDRKTL